MGSLLTCSTAVTNLGKAISSVIPETISPNSCPPQKFIPEAGEAAIKYAEDQVQPIVDEIVEEVEQIVFMILFLIVVFIIVVMLLYLGWVGYVFGMPRSYIIAGIFIILLMFALIAF